MAVKLIDNEEFYGYRVRRTVDGKLYQEYFSLKKGGYRVNNPDKNNVYIQACARDHELEKEQRNTGSGRQLEDFLGNNGRVKGINFLTKRQKNGTVAPIFQVGISSEIDSKIVATSFSIHSHGINGAWELAVASFCKHKKISKGSKLYKQILQNQPEVDLPNLKEVIKKIAYCSWCLQKTEHILEAENNIVRHVYRCTNCDSNSLLCMAPKCQHMTKGAPSQQVIILLDKLHEKLKAKWDDNFCAVHDGTITSFENLSKPIRDIDKFLPLFERKEPNYVKVGVYTGTAVVVAATAFAVISSGGAAAGPMAVSHAGKIAGKIGATGWLGVTEGGKDIAMLSGVAQNAASLKAIGGGMAVGKSLIAGTGAMLAGPLGMLYSSRYVGDDKSFKIKNIRQKSGSRTVFINGFLQKDDTEFIDWKNVHSAIFPNEKLFGVNWSSKSLKELASFMVPHHLNDLGKLVAKSSLISKPFHVAGIITNPWHVSMKRAEQTGMLLANAIIRSGHRNFTLVGHSLGCRVIYYALKALSVFDEPYVVDVILLGGAVGRTDKNGWNNAADAVSGKIYNCHSNHDGVLKYLYQASNAFQSKPIGIGTISSSRANIENINCDSYLENYPDFISHMKWKNHYGDILKYIY